MAKSTLADLLINLGVDSAELRRGLKTAQTELQKFSRDVNGIKRALEGAFAVVGVGVAVNEIKNLVMAGAEAADKMGKLAQSAGVPVEEFSKLSYAARLADVDVGDFAQTLGIFSKKVVEAAGSGGDSAFSRIGVAVADANGELRPTADILKDVSEKLAGYQDGAAKTALVLELFGRSGAKLMPLLNGGAAGMAALADEAQRLGLVINGETAAAAETFNDSLTRMKVMSERLGAAVAQELAPSIEQLAATLGNGASEADAYKVAAEKIGFALKLMVGMALAADHSFERLGMRIGAMGAVWVSRLKGDFEGARAILEQFGKDIDDLDKKYAARMDALGFTEGGGYNPPKPNPDDEGWAPDGSPQSHTPTGRNVPLGGAGKGDKGGLAKPTDAWQFDYRASSDAAKLVDVPVGPSTFEEMFSNRTEGAGFDANSLNATQNVTYLGEEFEKLSKKTKDAKDELSEFEKQAQRNATNLLADQLAEGFQGGIDKMLSAWGDMLKKMLAQAVAARLLSAIFGGGGGFLGGLFGGDDGWKDIPARALGGPVTAGQTYLVGERGPELFTAQTSGRIVPNENLGRGETYNVNVAVSAIDTRSGAEFIRRSAPDIVDAIERERKARRAA